MHLISVIDFLNSDLKESGASLHSTAAGENAHTNLPGVTICKFM